MSKEVAIPRALRELHGEKASAVNLASTYIAGAAVGILTAVSLLGQSIAAWRSVIAALVLFDVAGGVVANLSAPTRRYYARSGKKRMQFILLHILHPAVLAILFPGSYPYFLSCMAFTIGCCLVLERFREYEDRQNIASGMACAGIAAAPDVAQADAVSRSTDASAGEARNAPVESANLVVSAPAMTLGPNWTDLAAGIGKTVAKVTELAASE